MKKNFVKKIVAACAVLLTVLVAAPVSVDAAVPLNPAPSQMYGFPDLQAGYMVWNTPNRRMSPTINFDYLTPGKTYHVTYQVMNSTTAFFQKLPHPEDTYYNLESEKQVVLPADCKPKYSNLKITKGFDYTEYSGDVLYTTSTKMSGISLPYYWHITSVIDRLVIRGYTVTEIGSGGGGGGGTVTPPAEDKSSLTFSKPVVTIQEGTGINVKQYTLAYDVDGTAVPKSQITVDKSGFNKNIPGVYAIPVSFVNSNGKKITNTFVVVVEKKPIV